VRNSVKKWCGFGVVLMKSGEKKWKSAKKLQKVKENISNIEGVKSTV